MGRLFSALLLTVTLAGCNIEVANDDVPADDNSPGSAESALVWDTEQWDDAHWQ